MTAYSIWYSPTLDNFKLSEAIQIEDDQACDWRCLCVFNAESSIVADQFLSYAKEALRCII